MNKTIISAIALFTILTFGAVGYMILEGASFADGLYMTVITVTTVGFGETLHLDPSGRIFTIILIFIGVGFFMILFREITESVVEGGIQNILGKRKMSKKLEIIKNHYVICGFGRIGQVICKLLNEQGRSFVVIENSEQELTTLDELNYLTLRGDASDDRLLIKAGIERARGLIAVVSSDADNVYITLSARELNPKLFILARASDDERAETKLKRAGANQVISPYYIGAYRMANLILRPTVTDFIDLATSGDDLGLRLEEISLTTGASLVGKTLMASQIRKNFDLIVVLIKREDGSSVFNPTPDSLLKNGDTLVVLGNSNQITELERMLYANV